MASFWAIYVHYTPNVLKYWVGPPDDSRAPPQLLEASHPHPWSTPLMTTL